MLNHRTFIANFIVLSTCRRSGVSSIYLRHDVHVRDDVGGVEFDYKKNLQFVHLINNGCCCPFL